MGLFKRKERSKGGFDRMDSGSDYEKYSSSSDGTRSSLASSTSRLSDQPLPFLQPYVDRGVLYALIMKEALDVVIAGLGDFSFSLSLTNKTIDFLPPEGSGKKPLRFGAHVVASIAPGPHSVIWGHAVPPADNVPATTMLKRAESDGVVEMIEDEAVFDKRWSDPESITNIVAHRVAYAAVGMTSQGPYYSFATSSAGARMVVLLDDINRYVPITDLPVAFTRIPALLASHRLLISNPRVAIRGLADIVGWAVSEKGANMVIEDRVLLRFDRSDRLILLETV